MQHARIEVLCPCVGARSDDSSVGAAIRHAVANPATVDATL